MISCLALTLLDGAKADPTLSFTRYRGSATRLSFMLSLNKPEFRAGKLRTFVPMFASLSMYPLREYVSTMLLLKIANTMRVRIRNMINNAT